MVAVYSLAHESPSLRSCTTGRLFDDESLRGGVARQRRPRVLSGGCMHLVGRHETPSVLAEATDSRFRARVLSALRKLRTQLPGNSPFRTLSGGNATVVLVCSVSSVVPRTATASKVPYIFSATS